MIKTGYHALRLAIQGRQLMEHAHIELPMAAEDRAAISGWMATVQRAWWAERGL